MLTINGTPVTLTTAFSNRRQLSRDSFKVIDASADVPFESLFRVE
jgi:hypothetical protein